MEGSLRGFVVDEPSAGVGFRLRVAKWNPAGSCHLFNHNRTRSFASRNTHVLRTEK
jgi:hypothetical protein